MLDGCQTNLNCRKCPDTEIGAAENLAQLEVPEGETLCAAQADAMNCFYLRGLNPELSVYFATQRISKSEAASIGFEADILGEGLDATDWAFPALTVAPTGWTSAFWLIQQVHVGIH